MVNEAARRGVITAFFVMGPVLCWPIAGNAASPKCTEQEAKQAEEEACCLETWPAFYSSYQRYRHCDDAAIAEGFSSSVGTLLADHWDQIGDLVKLAKAHAKFRSFVLRHIDETTNLDQRQEIERHIRDRCPSGAKALCVSITKRFAEIDAD